MTQVAFPAANQADGVEMAAGRLCSEPVEKNPMETRNSNPSISVVIPLFNKQETIQRSISSILRQTRRPDELIVVDDGSTDRSLEITENAISPAGDEIDCRVIAQENAGVSAARNRGADESRSRYIAFFDADDEWLPDYLAELEKLALAFPSASVLLVRYAKVGRDGRLVPDRSPLADQYFGMVDGILDLYRRGYGLFHSSSIAVRRDAWERSGGFPIGARKSQDIYLWLKLCMTESFAHSGRPLSIWHDDHSGVSRRKGVVPYHFSHYLGTVEGRRYLENTELMKFLGSNLVNHIGGHRLRDDGEVVAELRRLSSALPFRTRFKCWVISVVPLWSLRTLVWWRRRSRGLQR